MLNSREQRPKIGREASVFIQFNTGFSRPGRFYPLRHGLKRASISPSESALILPLGLDSVA
eukprot:scaffold171804_cov35-Attheya_sp.AAC.1